jgi:hypothetical protein
MTRDRNKESRPTSTTEQNLDKNKGWYSVASRYANQTNKKDKHLPSKQVKQSILQEQI